ncbi:hypothetical protein SUGI_0694350, partial [Cryptomeria japonica]
IFYLESWVLEGLEDLVGDLLEEDLVGDLLMEGLEDFLAAFNNVSTFCAAVACFKDAVNLAALAVLAVNLAAHPLESLPTEQNPYLWKAS